MVSVEVIVPWRPSPERQRIWNWVRDRYHQKHPDWTVTEAPGRDGDWCKAWAVHDAQPTADVVVVADADVWCDGLSEAVSAVEQGAAWAMPHLRVHRLTSEATEAVLNGGPLAGELEQDHYRGTEGGGLVVLPRTTLQDVPLDPRFHGWGGEDHSWACALHTLAGPLWRGRADLWHLWHPPQPEMDRFGSKFGGPVNRSLHRRYMGGCHDLDRISRLVGEAKELLWASSSSSTDPA